MKTLGALLLLTGWLLGEMVVLLALCNLLGWTTLTVYELFSALILAIGLACLAGLIFKVSFNTTQTL
ncbi:MAG TPA: hypothetical protein PKA06_01650 [Gemmatales bacterium]|nr:hypothetical protein [Gemmatales bacterium]